VMGDVLLLLFKIIEACTGLMIAIVMLVTFLNDLKHIRKEIEKIRIEIVKLRKTIRRLLEELRGK